MSAQRTTGFGFGSMGGAIVAALALLAFALPAAAQWTHSGTASVGSRLGVGLQDPRRAVHLQSANAVFRMDRDSDSSAFMLVRTAAGDFDTVLKTWVVAATASGINTGTFAIADFGTQVGGVGVDRLRIDNLGDLWATGSNSFLQVAATTPNGYALEDDKTTILGNLCDGLTDEAFIALNDRAITLCGPGDSGPLLKIVDQDSYVTNYWFSDTLLDIRTDVEDYWIRVVNQGDNGDFVLSTTGEAIHLVADSDNNTAQNDPIFVLFNNGTANADKRMEYQAYGTPANDQLRIRGNFIPTYAFDLAEAYWKSDESISAGDVVCIDPNRPDAVVLARAANDPSVVGVVSTAPGIVLGGGAFSAADLEEIWSADVAARFAAERGNIEKSLASADPNIKGRIARLAQKKSALAKSGGKANEKARAKAEYEDGNQELANALESAALDTFFRNHFVRLSLAGRVPVKVDASYGAIQIGNLLVASATPGRAMRADNPAPGTVIGKALEPLAAGQGAIMMQVLNR